MALSARSSLSLNTPRDSESTTSQGNPLKAEHLPELSSSPIFNTEAFSCLGSNDCVSVGVLVGMAAVLADVELVMRGVTVTVLEAVAKDVLRTVEMGAGEVLGSTVLSSVASTGLIPGLVSDPGAMGSMVFPSKSPD